MPIETVQPSVPACPSSPGIEGHGEGVHHGKMHYYYRDGKNIPKDKVSPVRYEGGWAGRVHGEVHYLLLAWNGTSFSILDSCYPNTMKKRLAQFKGLTPVEAIKLVESENAQRQAELDARPKCRRIMLGGTHCGKPVMLFESGQKKHECYDCFLKRTGKK